MLNVDGYAIQKLIIMHNKDISVKRFAVFPEYCRIFFLCKDKQNSIYNTESIILYAKTFIKIK